MTATSITNPPLDLFQQSSAYAQEGPVLTIGGPGTGKTHSLIARIIAMVEQGVPTETITYLTFNSNGAHDVRRQLDHLMGIQSLFIGTVHQYASFFLRQAGATALDISPHYTIWDHEQAMETVEALNQEEPEDLRVNPDDYRELLHWHGLNQARFPEQELPAQHSSWHRLIDRYNAEKRRQNILDLNDLIPMAIRAMERDPELKENWSRNRSRHLLVDEFQDITPCQYHLIEMLTGPTKSIAIATDPNQSIYTWRGADIKLLTQFRMNHRDNSTHILRINHRSTSALSEMATTITNHHTMTGLHNAYQEGIRPHGERPKLLQFATDSRTMDRHAMGMARELNETGVPWEEMAFIYRKRTTGDRLVTAATDLGIHYTVLGDTRDQEQGDTRCITNLMTSILNPLDSNAFSSAASIEDRKTRRRLNPLITREIIKISQQKRTGLVRAAEEYLQSTKCAPTTTQNLVYIINAWRDLDNMLADPDTTIYNLCRRANMLIHEARGRRGVPPTDKHLTRILAFAENTSRLEGEMPRAHLSRFLELLSTAPYPDHRGLNNDDPFAHNKGITLSTVHSAKGLQWQIVWVMDANDHEMPGNLKQGPHMLSNLQEEQRIFYVAATRALNLLYFCATTGDHSGIDHIPTRFIEAVGEIDRITVS